MKIGVNLAVIDWNGNFAELPAILNYIGAEHVEFPVQLFQKNDGYISKYKNVDVSALSGILHKTELFPESILVEEVTFNKQLELLPEKLILAAQLGASSFSVGIDPWISSDIEIAKPIFTQRARILADKAAQHGISINFEYISSEVARKNGDKNPTLFCGNLQRAIQLIQEIDRENTALLLDILHCCADEKKKVELYPEIVKMVGYVHICDYKTQNKKIKNDMNRILPSQGDLAIYSFLSHLKKSGYKGYISIEVFRNDDYTPKNEEIRESIIRLKEFINNV